MKLSLVLIVYRSDSSIALEASKLCEEVLKEKETQIFPLSKKVGAKSDKVQLNLGVTDAFSFRSRFGSSRCIKFVDANHNEYITFSTSNFAYSLDEGDTVLCEAEIGGYKKRLYWRFKRIFCNNSEKS